MIINGIAASEGIGIGKVVVVTAAPKEIVNYEPENKESEIARFTEAADGFCEDTEKMAEELEKAASAKEADILRSHIQMARDPFVVSQITEEINNGSCAEAAAEKVLSSVMEMFRATGDPMTMERATDVGDIKNRLIMKLQGVGNISPSALPAGTVLVTEDLTPSMTVGITGDNVSGIVTAKGGFTSHSAILSRALEIPAVLSAEDIMTAVRTDDEVIVDGSEGIVIISPSQTDREKYKKKAEEFTKRKTRLRAYCGKPSVSADGSRKSIVANIGSPRGGVIAKNEDAEGIGLLRTEFLYMNRVSAPLEEEQFRAYKKVAETFGNKPVIIRTLDIGGDKDVPYLNLPKEDNPFIGCRAIRFCIRNPDLFRTQLRALLRAGAYGNVRIMLPMITTLEEVHETRKLLGQCVEELTREGKEFNPDVPLGIMIETPAAVIIADRLAEEVDFFSIGTNDLTGYTMCADRGNSLVSYLYSVFNPAVLTSIRRVCEHAHQAGIPVGMCGEAASEPALIPVLLAFGLDEFSVSHEKILRTRHNISLWTKEEADRIAKHALSLDKASEIRSYLNGQVKNKHSH
jgi:phosphotransferase system enzyme I (PtsI)